MCHAKTGVIEDNSKDRHHEEADTRMIFHAVDLAKQYPHLVIRADDTDVLLLLLYFCSKKKIGNQVVTQGKQQIGNASFLSVRYAVLLAPPSASASQLCPYLLDVTQQAAYIW